MPINCFIMSDSKEKCEVSGFQSLNAFSPALVNFEYGFHSKTDKSDLKCELYVDPENHARRSLVVKKDDINFIGKLTPDEQLCHTLLLIRNKVTKQGKILMTQSCSLINSAREEESLKRKKISKEQKNEGKDWQAQYHQLRQSFGSKKSKRASGVAVKLNLDMSLNQDDIKNTIADIDVKLNELNSSNQGDDEILKLLPPCNRSANKPEEVYSLDDILSKEERESLRTSAEFLIENGMKESDEKTNFFLFCHFPHLGSNPDIEKVLLLLYGYSLIKFVNMTAAEIRGRECLKTICSHSRAVASKILKEFTIATNSVRTRPSFCKDKVVCYLMITLLLACNFQLNIEVLSSCLKGFGQKKLIQLARVVGLTFVKGNAKEYSLKTPLPPLPQIRQPRKK